MLKDIINLFETSNDEPIEVCCVWMSSERSWIICIFSSTNCDLKCLQISFIPLKALPDKAHKVINSNLTSINFWYCKHCVYLTNCISFSV